MFFLLFAAFFVSHLAISTGESEEDLLKQPRMASFSVTSDEKQVKDAGDW